MNAAAIWAVPVIVAAFLLAGLLRGVDVLSAFAEGAKRGLRAAVSMLPSLMRGMTVSGLVPGLRRAGCPFLGAPPDSRPSGNSH